MINVNSLSASEISALNRLREPGVNKVLTVLERELESTVNTLFTPGSLSLFSAEISDALKELTLIIYSYNT
jgi:hypothetical protein